MRAGVLWHRVTLQSPTRTVTTDGYTDAWASYATDVPANVEAISSHEAATAATMQLPVTHAVTLRHRTDVARAHRVVFDGKTLYVVGLEPDRKLTALRLTCEERAA